MTLLSESGFGSCHDCGSAFDACECDWRAERRELLHREPCCSGDWGGSHYHCARCGAVTGMYGHFTTGVHFDRQWLKFGKETVNLPDGKTAEIDRGLFTCTDEYVAALKDLGLERVGGVVRRVQEAA